MNGLTDKVVLVTGGSSGIGQAIALRMGQEGANVAITTGGGTLESGGDYGAEGFIWQRYQGLPVFDGAHPVIGAWIVGDEAAGMGIREDASPITTDASRFVPHYFA